MFFYDPVLCINNFNKIKVCIIRKRFGAFKKTQYFYPYEEFYQFFFFLTETGLTPEEALDVLKIVFPEKEKKADVLSCSAYDILTEEKNLLPISTSSSAIDNILGGGIPVSKVTELCGCPGTGKTQLWYLFIF